MITSHWSHGRARARTRAPSVRVLALLAALRLALSAVPAWAADALDGNVTLDIPAQPLSQALMQFAREANVQVMLNGNLTDEKTSTVLKGTLPARQALETLLRGTGLAYRVKNKTVTVAPVGSLTLAEARPIRVADGDPPSNSDVGVVSDSPTSASAGDIASDKNTGENTSLEQVTVTGTHIRGAAPVGSPLVVYDRESIDQSGAATIAQFAQTMTENFTSTSPYATTYGNSSGGLNQTLSNGYGGSAFNLHGLGADSTLTLLDGHRLSAGGTDGSFVDLSLIPLSAVEKLEVLSDGASAIYGADAVAGVVNIVLKKNYDGAESSIRFGYPTDHGGQETTASQLLGKSWGTGNLMAVYEFDRQESIESNERDFIPAQPQSVDILPADKRQSVLLNGHQQLVDQNITLSGTFYYGDRESHSTYPNFGLTVADASTLKQYGGLLYLTHNFAVDWNSSLDANLSKTLASSNDLFPAFGLLVQNATNTELQEVGLQADGPLFKFGDGLTVRAALGAGLRSEQLLSTAVNIPTNLKRNVSDLYGELNLPLVASSQNLPMIDKLSVSAAVRYDHYGDFGSSTNPKIGISWSPIADLGIRASYATSFRPPLLNQLAPLPQFYTQLEPNAASPTGTTDTLINQSQGNPGLRPEKATSVNAGLDYNPAAIPNLATSTTYFRTNLKDQIGGPPVVGNIFVGAPIYAQPGLASFINQTPSLSTVQSIFNGPGFDGDLAGGGPAAVQAIFADEITNIARTVVSGVEGTGKYSLDTNEGRWTLSMAGTYYLENRYFGVSGAQGVSLLSIIGEPVRFRTRDGISWSQAGFGQSLIMNYSIGYKNALFTPETTISSLTTFDYQLTYRFLDGVGFTDRSGVSIALSVQNLMNRNPPFVAVPVGPSYTNIGFDAVNASPLGRVVALQVTKLW
jgi:iron complex outermembrane recepter protein